MSSSSKKNSEPMMRVQGSRTISTDSSGSRHEDPSPPETAAEEPPEDADRSLQETHNIFFVFRPSRAPETTAPTAAPTVRPLTRDFNFRACGSGSGGAFDGNDKSIPSGVANVHFVYDIELTDNIDSEEERTMLNALERAMIDSLFESACPRRRTRRILGSSSATSSRSRRLEIHSISSGNRDKLREKCAVTSAEASVCYRYDGSVKVGYTSTGDSDTTELEAGNTALRVVSRDMGESTDYIDAMNSALGSTTVLDSSFSLSSNTTDPWDSNSTMVTRISYVGTSFYDVRDEDQVFAGLQSQNLSLQENGSITTLGKVFVPIMVLLFVGMVAALYLGYKKHKRQRQVQQRAVYRARGDEEYLRRRGNDHAMNMDQFEQDLKDLAMRTTYQDVHRCNKTNCAACTQQLPHPIEEILSQRSGQDYINSEKVEVVEPDDQSSVSGLTGIMGERNWLGQIKTPKIMGEKSSREDAAIDGLFEDEPRSVTFLRVEGDDDSYYNDDFFYDDGLTMHSDAGSTGSSRLGVKRMIIDHSGSVRSEIEL